MLLFKLVVVILLGFVIISLFSALYFLNKDKGDTKKVVKSLAIRVGLSIFIFVLLMIGAATGLITPHGVAPKVQQGEIDQVN